MKFRNLSQKNLDKLFKWSDYNPDDTYGAPFIKCCQLLDYLKDLRDYECEVKAFVDAGISEELISEVYDLRDKIGRKILQKLKKLYPPTGLTFPSENQQITEKV